MCNLNTGISFKLLADCWTWAKKHTKKNVMLVRARPSCHMFHANDSAALTVAQMPASPRRARSRDMGPARAPMEFVLAH